MTDRDWDILFRLISKAISLPDLTADEKGAKIRKEAKKRDQEVDLEEFVAQVGCGEE